MYLRILFYFIIFYVLSSCTLYVCIVLTVLVLVDVVCVSCVCVHTYLRTYWTCLNLAIFIFFLEKNKANGDCLCEVRKTGKYSVSLFSMLEATHETPPTNGFKYFQKIQKHVFIVEAIFSKRFKEEWPGGVHCRTKARCFGTRVVFEWR